MNHTCWMLAMSVNALMEGAQILILMNLQNSLCHQNSKKGLRLIFQSKLLMLKQHVFLIPVLFSYFYITTEMIISMYCLISHTEIRKVNIHRFS